MDTIIFKETISIEPRDLTPDIEHTVSERVIQKYRNFCNKKRGYITQIKKVSIISNVIDRVSTSIFFNLQVEAERFLPREGLVIECPIHMCFAHGIIACAPNSDMKVFVAINTIPGAKHENGVIRAGSNTYRKDDVVKVELTNIKYENHKFSAMAKLAI